MGFLDFFRPARGARVNGETVTFAPTFMFTSDDVADFVAGVGRLSPEKIYEKTSLRTVLDFRARNFSQIGMHSYKRSEDGGRERDRSSRAAELLARPAPGMTWFELMWAVCLDYDLHARTFLLYNPRLNAVLHMPSRRVRLVSGSWEMGDFRAEVQPVDPTKKPVEVDSRSLIPFQVYNPGGSSPMESLKETMQEQAEAKAFRRASWKNGHQANRYIYRPKDAPEWTPEGRARFVEQMRAFKSGGGNQGGTPVLDDGMEFRSDTFKAVEDQVVEMAKLSREEYAAAYGVTLSMLGSPDGNSYANLKEYRRQLYGETLGPMFKMVEERLNGFLLPLTDPNAEGLYLEFNVKERLKSDPVDQAKVYQASVGAPIMTRNEARARENLPAVPGGDELITPLNVATGAVASPLDTAPDKNPLSLSAGVGVKAGRSKSVFVDHYGADVEAVRDVMVNHLDRQKRSVLSDLGAGREPDYLRWQEELFSDLQRTVPAMTRRQTLELLDALGLEEQVFSEARASSILAMLSRHADNITTAAITAALRADDAEHALNLIGERAGMYADTIVASTHNQRAVDVAKQGAKHIGGEALKMWVTTSARSRPAHAAMNGQTAHVGDPFSNGAMYPRHSVLGAAGVANCECQMTVTIEPRR